MMQSNQIGNRIKMELNNYNRKSPFITPKGYFENLEKNILKNSCGKQEANCQKRDKIRTLGWLRWTSYAATVAVIATIAIYMTGKNGTENSQATIAGTEQFAAITESNGSDAYELDEEYIDNLLSYYPIDDYTFYSYLTENE